MKSGGHANSRCEESPPRKGGVESLHSSGSFFGSLVNLHKVFGSCKNQVEQQPLADFNVLRSCPEELCDTAFTRNTQMRPSRLFHAVWSLICKLQGAP